MVIEVRYSGFNVGSRCRLSQLLPFVRFLQLTAAFDLVCLVSIVCLLLTSVDVENKVE